MRAGRATIAIETTAEKECAKHTQHTYYYAEAELTTQRVQYRMGCLGIGFYFLKAYRLRCRLQLLLLLCILHHIRKQVVKLH